MSRIARAKALPPRLHRRRRPGGAVPDRHRLLFLLMAMPRGRESARLAACQKNLAQIGLALALYDQTQRCLPTIGEPARIDPPAAAGLARSLEDPAGNVRPCRFHGALAGDRDSASRGTGPGRNPRAGIRLRQRPRRDLGPLPGADQLPRDDRGRLPRGATAPSHPADGSACATSSRGTAQASPRPSPSAWWATASRTISPPGTTRSWKGRCPRGLYADPP